MINRLTRSSVGFVCAVLLLAAGGTPSAQIAFARGDLIVSLETGPVLWWRANGTFNRVLVGTEIGTGEGMAFDAAGTLYVTRWCIGLCAEAGTGNTVERFNTMGLPSGRFGSGYDCSPHAIVFDRMGHAYVGQAGCSGNILKLVAGQPVAAYAVAPDVQGAFWIDLAPDGCTMFYTSYGPNVKRFDVCAGVQLPDFNVAPLPGGATQDLRVLPDGGVLVSSGEVIGRLNSSGVLTQTYQIPGEPSLWSGLDLVGDGTFWAGNYRSSNVYRFDLSTGAVRAGFNTGAPANNVVGIRVKR
jgi:hypothetical protein